MGSLAILTSTIYYTTFDWHIFAWTAGMSKEINALEYKKIRMEQDQKNKRIVGWNVTKNLMEDEEVDDYIASCNASAATRSNGEPDETIAAKRRNTDKGEEV